MSRVTPQGWRCAFCSKAGVFPLRSDRRLLATASAAIRRQAPTSEFVHGSPLEGPHGGFFPGFKRLDLMLKKSEDPRQAMRMMVERELDAIRNKFGDAEYHKVIGVSSKEAYPLFDEFKGVLKARMHKWPKDASEDELYTRLRDALKISPRKLKETVVFWFQHHITSKRLHGRPLLVQRMKELADMRNPFEWFPAARRHQRTIHLHIGPTNSGKTYHALKRLEGADSGVYAGPLRLLAREVYQRLNAAGKPCELLTGDERLEPSIEVPKEEAAMMSCTVEMTPVDRSFDVAVIDEIQMIADEDRGSAWAMAILGLQAKEIHLCGEERALELVSSIAKSLGEKLEVHQYERLSPLKVQGESLHGSWSNLRKGDCVVGFSVDILHALRSLIERRTRKKVAIVYGSLPPEIRTQQAALFNDPDSGYDILVASDAIGMGLNLNIQRVIFYSTSKRRPGRVEQLEYPALKQIAGRAGRFKVAPSLPSSVDRGSMNVDNGSADREILPETATRAPLLGLVTSLRNDDLHIVRTAMRSSIAPLKQAGIIAPEERFLEFCSLFPRGTPFSYILLRFHTIAQLHPLFRTQIKADSIAISDIIQGVPNMGVRDRLIFAHAPIPIRDTAIPPFAVELAKCVANNRPGPILDIPGVNVELLDRKGPATLEYLRELETLHKCLVLYNWLSFRFEAIFETRATASHIKSLVEGRIAQSLFELGTDFQENLKRDSLRVKQRRRRNRRNKETKKDARHSQPLSKSSRSPFRNVTGTVVSQEGAPISRVSPIPNASIQQEPASFSI